MRYPTALLSAALVWLTSTTAWATPEFPTVIQSKLLLAAAPPCTICHLSLIGGQGTVKTPFGMNLMARGLIPFDDDSLANALMLMDDGGVVSANGCRSDIDELKVGSDPNHPTDVAPCMTTGGAGGAAGLGGATAGGGTSPASGAPAARAGAAGTPLADDPAAAPVAQYGCRGSSIANASARSWIGPLTIAIAAWAMWRRRRL